MGSRRGLKCTLLYVHVIEGFIGLGSGTAGLMGQLVAIGCTLACPSVCQLFHHRHNTVYNDERLGNRITSCQSNGIFENVTSLRYESFYADLAAHACT